MLPSVARPPRLHVSVSGLGLVLIAVGMVVAQAGEGRDLAMVGWLIVATVVLHMTWAAVSAGFTHFSILTPADGTVGEPVTARIGVDRGPVDVAVRSGRGQPWTPVGPAPGEVEVGPRPRGVYHHVDVEIRFRPPLGIVGVRRRQALPLTSPLHVAPLPAPAVDLDPSLVSFPVVALSGEQVGVRAYATGDARRLVHWPATARTGELLVRQFVGQTTVEPTLLIVDLGPTPSAGGEQAAGRARWYGERLLDAAAPLSVRTVELGANGPVVVEAPVSSVVELGRRLARADWGRIGHESIRPSIVVSPEGDR